MTDDWLDGSVEEIKSAIERHWRNASPRELQAPDAENVMHQPMRRYCCSTFFQVESGLNCAVEAAISVVSDPRSF